MFLFVEEGYIIMSERSSFQPVRRLRTQDVWQQTMTMSPGIGSQPWIVADEIRLPT